MLAHCLEVVFPSFTEMTVCPIPTTSGLILFPIGGPNSSLRRDKLWRVMASSFHNQVDRSWMDCGKHFRIVLCIISRFLRLRRKVCMIVICMEFHTWYEQRRSWSTIIPVSEFNFSNYSLHLCIPAQLNILLFQYWSGESQKMLITYHIKQLEIFFLVHLLHIGRTTLNRTSKNITYHYYSCQG